MVRTRREQGAALDERGVGGVGRLRYGSRRGSQIHKCTPDDCKKV